MTTAKFPHAPWDINAYNLCEIIKIKSGPDAKGRTYTDGRHQERIAMVGCADENSLTWTERHAIARLLRCAPELFALAERVANLNEKAGEIGEGMLVQLVTEARHLVTKSTV